MKNIYLQFSILFLFSSGLCAQLSDWSTAPDFSLPDLNDDYHELYDYLDDGYSVVLDFSATWCGPCWNYHQTGTLEDIYDDYGPDGEDKVMVFMIEADPGTSQQCIYGPSGCSGGSIGDWTAGVSYPILNPGPAEALEVNNDFNINYYPTLYGVAPNGDVLEIGQSSYSEWESWVAESFQMHNTSWETNEEDCTDSFIDLQPVGGFGNIDYQWSNGAFSEDLYDIAPGDYYVTLTDDHNYEVTIGPIEVNNNNGADIQLIDIGHVQCAGGTEGYIDIEVFDSVGDFEFVWSDGSDSEDLEDVSGGEYTVIAHDTGSGCEFEFEFEIEEPEELEYELEIENAPCDEDQLGTVEFFVDGGSWPITFFYENFDTRDDYVELEPGDYTVTIMDINGCELVTEMFSIESVNAPAAYAGSSGILNCVNDSIGISVDSSSSGSNISYSWYNEVNQVVGNDSLVFVNEPGAYILNVVDNNSGCISVDSVFVEESQEQASGELSIIEAWNCNMSQAILAASFDQEDSLLVYQWTTQNGVILSDPNQSEIEAGAIGEYELTVTHLVSGCSNELLLQVDEPELPQIDIEGNLEYCAESGTEICIEYNSNERLDWDFNGESFTTQSEVTCVILNEEGLLTLTLTNEMTECSSSESFMLEELELPELELNGELSFCEGSQTELCIDTNVSEVNWYRDGVVISNQYCINVEDANSYTVVAGDNSSSCTNMIEFQTEIITLPEAVIIGETDFCDGDQALLCFQNSNQNTTWLFNGAEVANNTECINISQSGQVELRVVDPSSNCESSAMIQTTVFESPEIISLTSNGELGCETSEVSLSVELQSNDYTIEWFDPSGNLIATNYTEVIVQSTGNYQVRVVSENGCATDEYLEVTSNDDELPESLFDYQISQLTVSFENKSSVNSNSFLWDFGDGSTSTEENPVHSYTNPGQYSVQLISNNECGSSVSESEFLVFTDLQISLITSNVSCHGAADGRIKVNVFGGLPDYNFEWSLDGNQFSTDSELNMLEAGSYAFTLMDQAGQLIEEIIVITEPEPIVLSAEVNSSPSNTNEGEIDLTVTGGNGTYQFEWSNGSTDEDLVQLEQGTYSVTVTDEKQCSIIEEFEVLGTTSLNNIPELISFSFGPNPATNFVNVDINLDAPYQYKLKLIDATGRLHMSENLSGSALSKAIDLSELNTGLYFLSLELKGKSLVRKLIIAK